MPERNGILTALGRNVRRQREAKQLTQEKLAELIDHRRPEALVLAQL